jgi:multisubunit Na+/H+ antiporter MnhB subunit
MLGNSQAIYIVGVTVLTATILSLVSMGHKAREFMQSPSNLAILIIVLLLSALVGVYGGKYLWRQQQHQI